MTAFSAYLALSTARDKLQTLESCDEHEFADVLTLLEDAIAASKHPASAEKALDVCQRASDCLNKEIAKRNTPDGVQLAPIVSEAAQIARGALYHAAVELRSALKKSLDAKDKDFLACRVSSGVTGPNRLNL